MHKQVCHKCGSQSFRADRALAGRVICSYCSTPLVNNFSINSHGGLGFLNLLLRRKFLLFIGLTIVLILIVNNL